LRKRYYIIFVSRDEEGQLKKIPVPLKYAYGFLGAALIGMFTITGMAGSYARMMVKTERFNQLRTEREALRKDYKRLEEVDREKDVQAASLGSLASEVSALYGLRQSKLAATKEKLKPEVKSAGKATSAELVTDNTGYNKSLDQFYALRSSAMSGVVLASYARSNETGLHNRGLSIGPTQADWSFSADAPSIWPVIGPVTSSFGQREDPFKGEGAFHAGIDISAPLGEPVHAAADGFVETAGNATGYGREVRLDHGHGLSTLYGHLSGFAVTAGQLVTRGQIIGYVGHSGRSTGSHLHYEVRIHDSPVNPHKYMHDTPSFAAAQPKLGGVQGGGGE
jgi:murein DD-endopeptidase MepM/ murein hydrolase activator NlpD